MKSQFYLWGAIATLMVGGIACGGAPEANGYAAAVEDNPLEGQKAGVATAALPLPTCLTWSDYQAYNLDTTGEVIPTYLQMPPGFQQGCVFQAGFSLTNPVYILRDGLDFAAIARADSSLTPDPDSPVPRFDGIDVDYDAIAALTQQSDLLVHYNACSTIGRHQENCEGFPQDRPYLLRETTACFQGHCLEGGTLSGEQRLALWSGYSAEGAKALTAEQAAARRQYEEIPLERLGTSLPVIVRDGEALAFELFGRSQLREGEQDTVLETLGAYENYQVLQVTNLGAADDSVGGQRYRLEFEYFDNDQLHLVWVGQQRYCRRSTPPTWTAARCP